MKMFRISVLILAGAIAVPHVGVHAQSSTAPDQGKTTQLVARRPAIILIIRHAEKPKPEEKSSDLSPVGYHRAELLPSLFIGNGFNAPRFPRPDVLFATKMSKHSDREVETLEPLSAALHLPISHDYLDEEVDQVAKEIMSGKYAGKVVLICWHHGKMPDLARALGAVDAPTKIADDVFDQVWRIEWRGDKVEFSVSPEHLLPGDAVK